MHRSPVDTSTDVNTYTSIIKMASYSQPVSVATPSSWLNHSTITKLSESDDAKGQLFVNYSQILQETVLNLDIDFPSR